MCIQRGMLTLSVKYYVRDKKGISLFFPRSEINFPQGKIQFMLSPQRLWWNVMENSSEENWRDIFHDLKSQQAQNICITFVQRRPNLFDVGPTLYKCYTSVLSLLGFAFPSPQFPPSSLQVTIALYCTHHFSVFYSQHLGLTPAAASPPFSCPSPSRPSCCQWLTPHHLEHPRRRRFYRSRAFLPCPWQQRQPTYIYPL